MYDNLSRVIEVDIDEILPNRFQPRIQFDEEEILELSDSIKEHGVIQPLVVRTIGDKYEIIAGERRYKASVLAGKETVPVIVKKLNDKDSAEIALIENIQRKNLTPIEEALSYKKILDMGYITQENLATKLGKSQSAVANKIRLLNLSDEVQEALLENKISERHARSLLKLSTSKQQNEILNRIITERLTVRKADEEIEKIKNSTSDESNDDTQKIIEKGEIEMNNNMFGMPNIPQTPQPSFDIFGTQPQQPVEPQQPVVNSIPEVQSAMPQTSNFDIFGSSASGMDNMSSMPTFNPTTEVQSVVDPVIPSSTVDMPMMPTMESIPSAPVFNAVPEVQPIIEPQQPVAPVVPEMPMMPTTMESIPSTSAFNAVPEVQSIIEPQQPVAPVVPEMPMMPTMESIPSTSAFNAVPEVQSIIEPQQPVTPQLEPSVPFTAPIIESPVLGSNQMQSQTENLFSFESNNLNSPEPTPVQPEQSSIPEFKMPEPIIITDYSKQYDPVMPLTPETMAPTVDFKEVINAIRECSNKIEQYGFKIDVEEYDLANLYQVVFKIEK